MHALLRHPRIPRPIRLAMALALSATPGVGPGPSVAAPPPASTQETLRAQCLLRDGRWIDGRLLSLDDKSLAVSLNEANAGSTTRDVPRGEMVACLVGPAQRRSMAFLTQLTAGTIVLTDGQFIPGSFRAGGPAPRWEHRWIGMIPLKTDSLSEIRFAAARRAPARADADTILFTNGDLATGFVESLGEEVVFEPSEAGEKPGQPEGEATTEPKADAAPAKRRIQLERIAAIAFAALDRPASPAALVWTDDGTIVRAADIVYSTAAGWRFALTDPLLAAGAGAKPLGEGSARPAAILFEPAAVTPLVACGAPECAAPGGSYRYETSPELRLEPADGSMLGLGSIELDGPVQARFALPAATCGAARKLVFSAELALLEPVPADARAVVTVRFGKSAAQEVVLDAVNRRAQVRVEAVAPVGTTLEILLEDGGNGIAGDRIAIHRGCFILQG